MKLKNLKWLLLIAITCSLPLSAAELSKVILLHTNDVHGNCLREPQKGFQGVPAVAALKESLSRQGFTVFLLDAGDAMQDNILVNLSKGKALVEIFNEAGYDAATFGNHEFEYGQDELSKRMREARYPYVSANVIVEETGKTLSPSGKAILEKNGIKVGVFGLTTPQSQSSNHPANVRGLRFAKGEELYKLAQEAIDSLKAQGADLIVCLSHLGSEPQNKGSNSEDVLTHTHGIDVLIDGHDHKEKSDSVNNIPRGETGCYLRNIGMMFLDGKDWKTRLIPYGVLSPENDDLGSKEVVERIKKEVDAVLSKEISSTTIFLNGQREPGIRTEETNLGDLVADAYLWQVRQFNPDIPVDAAIANGGSIRISLKPGPIMEKDLQALLPYSKGLYVVAITGEKLKEILGASTWSLPKATSGFPQVAGISYTIDTTIPFVKGAPYPGTPFFAPEAGSGRITVHSVGGRPFAPDSVYRIAVSSFIAAGGDTFGGLLCDFPAVGNDPSGIGPAVPPLGKFAGTEEIDHG